MTVINNIEIVCPKKEVVIKYFMKTYKGGKQKSGPHKKHCEKGDFDPSSPVA